MDTEAHGFTYYPNPITIGTSKYKVVLGTKKLEISLHYTFKDLRAYIHLNLI